MADPLLAGCDDVRGFLEYGSLNVFFGGLEGQVGSPSPKVWQMMAEEHTNRGDSNCTFTTINYSLTTSSFIEYKFVAEPDAPPSEGWPGEDKSRRAELGDEGAGDGHTLLLTTTHLPGHV